MNVGSEDVASAESFLSSEASAKPSNHAISALQLPDSSFGLPHQMLLFMK